MYVRNHELLCQKESLQQQQQAASWRIKDDTEASCGGGLHVSRTPDRQRHQPDIEHFLFIISLEHILVTRFILHIQHALPGPALLDVCIVP